LSNKKITDLQLISTLDDDVNLVGDDTIQTYRFTLAQLKSFINQEIQSNDWVTTIRILNGAVTGPKLGIGAGNITESGSDTNGRYIKFEDGTMLQWGEVETTQGVNISRGSLFIRYGSTITFPEEFNSVPEVFVNYKSNSGSIDDREFWATGATPTTTTCPTCLWSPTSVGSATHVISWNAIGRWKT